MSIFQHRNLHPTIDAIALRGTRHVHHRFFSLGATRGCRRANSLLCTSAPLSVRVVPSGTSYRVLGGTLAVPTSVARAPDTDTWTPCAYQTEPRIPQLGLSNRLCDVEAPSMPTRSGKHGRCKVAVLAGGLPTKVQKYRSTDLTFAVLDRSGLVSIVLALHKCGAVLFPFPRAAELPILGALHFCQIPFLSFILCRAPCGDTSEPSSTSFLGLLMRIWI